MKIDLDGILLDDTREQPDGSIVAGRSVSNISTADKRNVESYDAPGAQGSTYKDLGRSAVVISFDGTVSGADAGAVIASIRSRFKAGEPVPFLSDLTGAADITRVLIDRFAVKDAAGSPDRYDYSIVLKEYREPPEEPSAGEDGAGAPARDGEAEAWADEAAEEAEGSVNTITGKVLDADGNPKKGVKVTITFADGELTAETDDEGAYRFENLEPGEYTATVEGEGYEVSESKLTVGDKKEAGG